MSLFIHNAQVFLGNRLEKTNIVIADGTIVDITEELVTCEEYIDAEGCVVIPGMIECDGKGDLLGCMEALKGGITTVILDHEPKKDKAYTNFWWHHKIKNESAEEIRGVKEAASVRLNPLDITQEKREATIRRLQNNAKRASVTAIGETALFAIQAAKEGKGRLYISSVGEEIKQVKKANKQKLFLEVKSHALENGKVLECLKKGLVDTISSEDLAGGLTTVLRHVEKKDISIAEAVALTSTNPSNIFGMKKKGAIEIGNDADLTICKTGKECSINIVIVNGIAAYFRGEIKGKFGKSYKEEKDELPDEASENEQPHMPGFGPGDREDTHQGKD